MLYVQYSISYQAAERSGRRNPDKSGGDVERLLKGWQKTVSCKRSAVAVASCFVALSTFRRFVLPEAPARFRPGGKPGRRAAHAEDPKTSCPKLLGCLLYYLRVALYLPIVQYMFNVAVFCGEGGAPGQAPRARDGAGRAKARGN